MKVGVVVLNYNDAHNTSKLVNLIKDYEIINNIVIIDNNSGDDSIISLKKFRNDNKIQILESNRNGGYGYGNNIGIEFLINNHNSDYIFIANPDVMFEEQFLYDIIDKFIENPDYAILTGVMLNKNKEIVKKPYWNLPTYVDDIKDCMTIFRMLSKFSKKYLIDFSVPLMEVDVIPGSLFGIRVEAKENSEIFDENTFLYYEENILAKKIRKKGLKSGIVTITSFMHMHGSTVRKNLKAVKNHSIHLKSKYYYETKYNGISNIQKILLKVMMIYSLFEFTVTSPIKEKINIKSKIKRKVYEESFTSSYKK